MSHAKDKTNPMYGKTHSKETRRKMSEAKKGKYNGEYNPMFGQPGGFLGKTHSEEVKMVISKRMSGKNHPNWKGGKTKLSKRIRNHTKMRAWKQSIMERDNFTCLFCGTRGGKLNVDHIKPFYRILDDNKITSVEAALSCSELWNTHNGRTLCAECHKTTKTFGNPNKVNKLS
jgi:5-methylcytosine-specific restriction endonuclease McrA